MDWTKLANDETIERTRVALQSNKINVIVVNDKAEALSTLISQIPEGADLTTASSTTLNQIGFTDLLKSGAHRWENLKDEIVKETDPVKQSALRIKASSASYIIGSVHAVTESGETITASASGSQLPGYAFSSPNVIWVVGTQKITKDVDEGMKRIREHSVPLEDKRMKAAGYPGTNLAKILIMNREILPRKITLILVKEELGF